MPMFEYECPHCHQIEVRWIMDTSEICSEHCSKCGTEVRRLISPPSLRFIGDGWTTPRAEEGK